MKIKRSDRSDWRRVKKRRYALIPVEHETFCGHASLFCMDEFLEPLWVPYAGRLICVADQGHHWLQMFPQGARHVITVMYDQDGVVTQWYIDICKRSYMDDRGEMWYEDLYLDIIFTPGDKIELIDVDDLDEALRQGAISDEEYNLAWKEASNLLTALEEGTFGPLLVAAHCRELLLAHMAK
ncbi:DUF402 domain-containing protein [Ktedonospora formicarum]|uniref:DUF402 domain-containing protein n=1 Tax=Ktedonospora formicarum TaxID=2778364 RepID=A0A8J3HSU7_9CHLR|nr:DUF402 domain-containing protein [Ktedonospora formicarum]GHO42621.1 hypothetical protein KSX_07840 [Ktedonospora formicarum]